MTNSDSGVVILESREGDFFEAPIKAVRLSGIIGEIIDDDEAICDESILLKNVSAFILFTIILFCEHYHEEPMTPILPPLASPNIEDLVQEWYAIFIKRPDQELFELAEAANHLDIEPLLNLTVYAIAVGIEEKSAVELREIFAAIRLEATEDNRLEAPEEENFRIAETIKIAPSMEPLGWHEKQAPLVGFRGMTFPVLYAIVRGLLWSLAHLLLCKAAGTMVATSVNFTFQTCFFLRDDVRTIKGVIGVCMVYQVCFFLCARALEDHAALNMANVYNVLEWLMHEARAFLRGAGVERSAATN